MSLIGDTVNIGDNLRRLLTLGATVGDGVEATYQFRDIITHTVDLDGDSIEFSWTNNSSSLQTLNGSNPYLLTLWDLNWVDDPNKFVSAVTVPDGSGITPSITVAEDGSSQIVLAFPRNFEFAPNSTTTFSFDITTECFLPGTNIMSATKNLCKLG